MDQIICLIDFVLNPRTGENKRKLVRCFRIIPQRLKA